MQDPEATAGVPVQSSGVLPEVKALARALEVPEARVEAALAKVGGRPREFLQLVMEGAGEDRLEALAHALHVGRARLAVALVESGQETAAWVERAQAAGERVVATARHAVEDVVEFSLELVAESLPSFFRRIILVLAASGVALSALGVLAVVNPELFLDVILYVVGAGLVFAGGVCLWLAWRVYDATVTVRTLARLARRWRARRSAGSR